MGRHVSFHQVEMLAFMVFGEVVTLCVCSVIKYILYTNISTRYQRWYFFTSLTSFNIATIARGAFWIVFLIRTLYAHALGETSVTFDREAVLGPTAT